LFQKKKKKTKNFSKKTLKEAIYFYTHGFKFNNLFHTQHHHNNHTGAHPHVKGCCVSIVNLTFSLNLCLAKNIDLDLHVKVNNLII
jgi:hypothetical protein